MVRDLDNPARQPVQYFLNAQNNSIFVPEGKRFVVEFVSGFYVIDSGPPGTVLPDRTSVLLVTKLATQNREFIQHRISAYKAQVAGLTAVYEISQLVRLYADPGTHVSLAPPSGQLALQFFISGHLVDVP
jgi:hypothetical protein